MARTALLASTTRDWYPSIMAITLTAAINSSVKTFAVTGTVTQSPGYEFWIDSEMFRLEGFVRAQSGLIRAYDHNVWRVKRAINGSAAASHLISAELFSVKEVLAAGSSVAPTAPARTALLALGVVGDLVAETIGATASAGTTGVAADSAHRHAMPAAAAPAGMTIASTQVTGTAGTFADSAHVHAFTRPTVRAAAEVPSGAPTASELPIAFDSTAVSGGIYYWTGAAWVKGGTI